MVGNAFVPTAKYNEEKNKVKSITSEYETFKQSKMTDEEKQANSIKQNVSRKYFFKEWIQRRRLC